MKSLFSTSPTPDTDYAHVWRRVHEVDGAVERIDRMWSELRQYADSNFVREFPLHPYERSWELILGATLLRRGHRLAVKGSRGPDFKVLLDDRCVWIEATSPTAGTGPDSIPSPPPDALFDYPERQTILRIRGAIEAKHSQFGSFVSSGLVDPTDCFVIAVNSMQFPFLVDDPNSPAILKAVLPFGRPQLLVNRQTGEMRDGTFEYRPAIEKLNGSEVAMSCFLDPAYAQVSAVLLSEANFLMDADSEFANRYTTLVHNPLATTPLPRGWLGFGSEIVIRVDDDNVTWSLARSQFGGSG